MNDMSNTASKEKCIEVNHVLFLDFENQFKKVYNFAPSIDVSEREVVYWLYMHNLYKSHTKELNEP